MKLIKKSIIFAIIMIIAVSFSYNYDAYAESYNSISDSSDDDWVYNEYDYIVLSAKEIEPNALYDYPSCVICKKCLTKYTSDVYGEEGIEEAINKYMENDTCYVHHYKEEQPIRDIEIHYYKKNFSYSWQDETFEFDTYSEAIKSYDEHENSDEDYYFENYRRINQTYKRCGIKTIKSELVKRGKNPKKCTDSQKEQILTYYMYNYDIHQSHNIEGTGGSKIDSYNTVRTYVKCKDCQKEYWVDGYDTQAINNAINRYLNEDTCYIHKYLSSFLDSEVGKVDLDKYSASGYDDFDEYLNSLDDWHDAYNWTTAKDEYIYNGNTWIYKSIQSIHTGPATMRTNGWVTYGHTFTLDEARDRYDFFNWGTSWEATDYIANPFLLGGYGTEENVYPELTYVEEVPIETIADRQDISDDQKTWFAKHIKEIGGENNNSNSNVDINTVILPDIIDSPNTVKKDGGNEGSQFQNKQESIPKYSNEWINGKWYDKNGKQSYSGTLSWKNNSTGWWVEDSTGWYPQNQWQKIDGIWYFFKPDGYMAENEYYNGYWFNGDGSWDEQYYLTWKSNSTGWWVEDKSGWWPSSKWLKINGNWYYFDLSGYMVTNQYVDGYWIGANGVCQ